MKGLAGRKLIPLADEQQRADLERAVQELVAWEHSSKAVCAACRIDYWKRRGSTCDTCQNCCQHPRAVRGYMRKSNGEVSPQAVCMECGARRDIPTHDRGPVLDICVHDNSNVPHRRHPCARCGIATGVELHHWAPRAIFNDADEWPTAYLCPGCHRTWHQAMRDAAGYGLAASRRVGPRPTWWGGAA